MDNYNTKPFNASYGDGVEPGNVVGKFQNISFKEDGTFNRTYKNLKRGNDYKPEEMSGGCNLSMKGSYTVKDKRIKCTVKYVQSRFYHDFMLSDFKEDLGVNQFVKGCVFYGEIKAEGGFVLDNGLVFKIK